MLYFCLYVLLIGSGTTAFAADPAPDTCVSCHTELDDDELTTPVRLMADDVHSRQGLSCADCHGGDPSSDDEDESMYDNEGFTNLEHKKKILLTCGKCHSDAQYMRQYSPSLRVDQLDLYHTSVHGQRLLEKGDTNVAACTDCHGAHGILPSSDPRSPVYAANVPQTCSRCHSDADYMQDYDIPTDQYDKYSKSVHGRPLIENGDLSAPACNDCHGNHGATPPGISSLANVCGQCHAINNELVSQSPHQLAFEKLDLPACEVCHSYHDIATPTDALVGPEPPAVCAECHRSDKLPKGWEAAGQFRATLDSLTGQMEIAQQLSLLAERKGMEVGEIKFDLNETNSKLIQTRSTLHSFNLEKVAEIAHEGMELAVKVQQDSQAALDEFEFRRKGLGLSLVVIVILGVALFIKIRSLDEQE